MSRALNKGANLFLLVLYSMSIAYLMAQSFGCSLGAAFPLWLGLLCLCLWIASSFRHGIFLGFPPAVLALYLIWRIYGGELALELTDLLDKFTGAYFEHFYAAGSSYVFLNAVNSHTASFLFLAFLLAAYMATALSSPSARVSLGFIGSLPLFAACLAVNGRPGILPVLGLLLFWLLLILGGDKFDPVGNQGRAVFAGTLPAVLLLTAGLLFFGPERYSYSQEDISLSQRFDRLGAALSRWLGEKAGELDLVPPADSAPDNGGDELPDHGSLGSEAEPLDLEAAANRDDLDTVYLEFKTEQDGHIYLRGRSYGEYTGTGWLPAEEGSPADSLPFTAAAAAAAGGQSYEMELSLSFPGECMLIPYYSLLSDGDSFVPSGGEMGYSLKYVVYPASLQGLQLPEEYAQAELAYREYARDVYTRLPQETGEAVRAIAAGAGLVPESPGIIQEVASYIQTLVPYDIGTLPYPSDDFALYFLQEAESGYCVHFATAAAVMYRSLGIPARVTEGFLAQSEPGSFSQVRGENAHAWVEVYVDGTGWLPVEVTGSSGDVQPAPASPIPAVQSPEDSGETVPSSSPTAPTEPSPALPVGIIGTGPEVEEPAGQKLPRLLPALLLPAILVSALPLWRFLRLSARKRSIYQKDGSRAAVAILGWARQAAPFGQAVPREITDTAEKASFSRHTISREELIVCRKLLEKQLHDSFDPASPFKKFIFKYIKALI